jgi:membrane protein YqaA with SNARE-associated domain
LKRFAHKIETFFLALTGPLGGWGLLLIALFDSSFLSLPEVNDILIITLSIKNPDKMPYYCGMTTLGSVLGCLLLYTVGRKGGDVFLRRKFAEHRIESAGRWYNKYGILTVLVPSILPPPTPFKVFVLFAGAFQTKLSKFILAVTLGRGLRYFFEGYLAVEYGERARDYMHENYPYIALALGLAVVFGFLVFYLIRRSRPSREEISDSNRS